MWNQSLDFSTHRGRSFWKLATPIQLSNYSPHAAKRSSHNKLSALGRFVCVDFTLISWERRLKEAIYLGRVLCMSAPLHFQQATHTLHIHITKCECVYVCRLFSSRTHNTGGYSLYACLYIHIALRAIDRLQFRTWAATSCERNRGYLLIILNEGYTQHTARSHTHF
jgi:hypothetical protein